MHLMLIPQIQKTLSCEGQNCLYISRQIQPRTMTQWLSQTDFINNISRELLKPRIEHYSEDSYMIRIKDRHELDWKHLKAINGFQEKIYAVLVDWREKKSEYCLIYMHGMGSNTLEGSNLIDYLFPNMALCCFDFSGSGKSQGFCSTYGIKEYQDIGYIIKMLKNQGYAKFVLWGRSMGAFASLAFTSTEADRGDCILQILDSPFSNFESVCQQRAKIFFGFPDFLVNYAVNLMKQNLSEHPFNPFKFDLKEKLPACRVSSIFVYNEHDEVIPSQNTQELIRQIAKNCNYERMIIEDTHNNNRSPLTLRLIFEKIKKYVGSYEHRNVLVSKRKAINVCSSLLKKHGSIKDISLVTEVETVRTKRRAALFCSLSKQINSSPRKNAKHT